MTWREGGTSEQRQAVILAGGKGTRLRSRLRERPKPLVEISGIPLLGHQLQLLRKHGFTDIVLLVNYAAEQIYEYCRTFDTGEIRISIIDDGEPRGTAGAVLNAAPQLASQFIVLYGDTMLDVDLTRFWDWHSRDANAAASLILHPNDHPQDSDLVVINTEHRILQFHSYPRRAEHSYLPNLVNAALYIVNREALPEYDESGPLLDFARDLFPQMLQSGAVLRGYLSAEYIKDVGTPERLDRVNRDFSAGAIGRASLRFSKPAIFVDRDGTLNEDRGHIASPEDLVIFDFVAPAVRRLNGAQWPTIIVTNQPVLARGEASYHELRRIQGKLDSELARYGAYFDRVYFCPHHPHSGFPGEVSELKIKCDCRKPAPGLIYQAQRDFNLDLAESWFIGDSAADIGAAAAAGITSILVLTGLTGRNGKHSCQPDFVAKDFAAAVDFILDVYPLLACSCRPILELIESGSGWFVAGASQFARRSLIATLKRELRRLGKSASVQHTEDWPTSPLALQPDTVNLWEGRDATERAREAGMLRHSIWVHDSGLQDELPEAMCAAHSVNWPDGSSSDQSPGGMAA